ncbi:MAG: fluoride efflux transporter CrcB [Xenococcaceae cyanobacterium]
MLNVVFNLLLAGVGKIWTLIASIDPMLRTPIAISLGAIPGALSRYYITLLASRWFGSTFPYGTFFINLTGALLMGFFVTFTLERAIASPNLRLLIAVGFLGSYTTFSTYTLDSKSLLSSGNYQLFWLYWLGSAVLGVIFLELGSLLARKLL